MGEQELYLTCLWAKTVFLSLVQRFLPLGRHLASQCRNGTHFRNIPPVSHHQLYLPHPFNPLYQMFSLGQSSLPVRPSSDSAYAESQVTLAQPGGGSSSLLLSCAVDTKY